MWQKGMVCFFPPVYIVYRSGGLHYNQLAYNTLYIGQGGYITIIGQGGYITVIGQGGYITIIGQGVSTST